MLRAVRQPNCQTEISFHDEGRSTEIQSNRSIEVSAFALAVLKGRAVIRKVTLSARGVLIDGGYKCFQFKSIHLHRGRFHTNTIPSWREESDESLHITKSRRAARKKKNWIPSLRGKEQWALRDMDGKNGSIMRFTFGN